MLYLQPHLYSKIKLCNRLHGRQFVRNFNFIHWIRNMQTESKFNSMNLIDKLEWET